MGSGDMEILFVPMRRYLRAGSGWSSSPGLDPQA